MAIIDNFKKYLKFKVNDELGNSDLVKKENKLTGILLVNLGTPDYFDSKDIRKYLMEFLSDPKVINLPRLIWIPILYFVSLLRSRKLEQSYAKIWMRDGSPLSVYSKRQLLGLENRLDNEESNNSVKLSLGMRYGKPSIKESLNDLIRGGCNKILILPLYPQYSYTTTASVMCEVYHCIRNVRDLPEIRFIKRFYNENFYIKFLTEKISSFWKEKGRSEKLIISFHGLPVNSINKGDPYYYDCIDTANLICNELNIPKEDIEISFQSHFGFGKWLKPYTSHVVKRLARNGVSSVDIICPGFVSDCLETLEDVQEGYKKEFLEFGGKIFRYISAPNDNNLWLDGMSDFIKNNIKNWN
ncbi:Ferrochelatase [Candidatus Kinetoplastibacterium sorsogonicusi]|uniref:Ferrochelatase n=1 Tax=Candidatus Kinetoplastidibacterium kentomonadis TaxID=1576550 RepID=A0A3Q8EUI4_9PROT|nr:ferrochelatase [Candidatus Kinetoplastibacterium sorsogonicusi]AWD32616.1 Ferrochelatase [Candidatus Kinetoplastibacterium sorsogonicusi]